MPKKGILERLKEGPVLGDGGYLLELEKRGWVRAGPFTPEVALTRPDALRELHVEFREAGADVLQALTFYAAATSSRPSAWKTSWPTSIAPPSESRARWRVTNVWLRGT